MVRFSVRSVLTVIGLVVATWALLTVVEIARHVIVWVLVSIFLALALNPAVEWFMKRGVRSRGLAAGYTYIIALVVLGCDRRTPSSRRSSTRSTTSSTRCRGTSTT